MILAILSLFLIIILIISEISWSLVWRIAGARPPLHFDLLLHLGFYFEAFKPDAPWLLWFSVGFGVRSTYEKHGWQRED